MPTCPSCITAEHVIDDIHNGIIVCTGCGTQIGEQMINEGAEWRTFSEDTSRGEPSRIGGIDNTIRGVGTTIAGNGVLSHRHNQASLTSSQLVMERVMHLCKTYQRRLDLEMQIYHEAERICKLVIEAPTEYRGKTLKQDTLAAVCIHLACRNKAQDRKKSDVIAVAAVNEKAFNKQFQRVTTILHYLARQANAKGQQIIATPRDESLHFITRFGNTLGLSSEVIHVARCVVVATRELDIASSTQPSNLAAAALYFVCLIDSGIQGFSMQKRIEAVSTTKLDTLVKLARILYEKRMYIVPKNYKTPKEIENMPKPERQR